MLFIALAAVIGTTLTVWALHFMHLGGGPEKTAATFKRVPRIAVLPFHSLSAAADDANYDRELTGVLIAGLATIARVEVLPAGIDADPVGVGRELGVKALLIGKVQRLGHRVKVSIQLVSAKDGNQAWAGTFDSDSRDLARLSMQIDNAVARHLTALLD